ncbi:isocitrate lyase/PEP mutase family protein [Massilia endophytica]|uniref:isocitrate lyase/PEP mutase family protein n=1 Tax=Massilia endophytica TaxID=2899220 RepID=UPI001E512FDA|nr:isocitrate lyase/phosphoenolpyruvate mutase family protein [Massilia endophytica]UGQ47479.1 isocitrate lyase/phosphoenolpyruvate mutase family protein [Massilia endophytica]
MSSFHALHAADAPLLIANAWDVPSALAAQAAGYAAIATSSAAIAGMLGYEDGEGTSFDELLFIVRRIRASTTLPLSVDIEGGYADDADSVAANAQRLQELGIVGINIEDSRVVDGKRQLLPPEHLAGLIAAIRSACPELFINARTDPFLLGVPDALQETLSRGRQYIGHGADGIFAPCITEAADIREVAGSLARPVNVLAMPRLPDFATLAALGVKRISMGNAVHGELKQELRRRLDAIRSRQSFAALFSHENQ